MGILKKHPVIFMGLGITFVFLWFGMFRVEFLDTLEFKYYDARMKLKGDVSISSEIVLVEIDNDSIEKLGRWPWPRSIIAEGVRKINAGNPKIIGLNIIYSEPEEGTGLKAVNELEVLFKKNLFDETNDSMQLFYQAMKDTRLKLDNDKKLTEALRESGRVVLPVFFKDQTILDEGEADEALLDHSIYNVDVPEGVDYFKASEILLPIKPFFETSKGVGHINYAAEIDGTVRKERLIYEFNGLFIPSYTLRIAALYLNIPIEKIIVDMGSAVYLGPVLIPTTIYSEMLVNFKSEKGKFKNYSFYDVINDKIPLSIFKNKIVLVSHSAKGLTNPLSTPVDPFMNFGEFSANIISSILHRQFVKQPQWDRVAELLLIIFIGFLITFVFPRLKAVIASITFIIMLFFLIGGSTYLFVIKEMWVQVTYPILQLVAGYIGVVSIKFFITEAGQEKAEGESAETNKMLGISFQEQGMLDMAFEKFQKVPIDDGMRDILYNLGLDFERKRQFNKAASVYESIEKHDNKFKDVSDRKKKLMQASETMVFGDGFFGSGGGDGLDTGLDTRPTLGRYEVVKQLGKGAMGIVYLGQDPRINRTTAIKTVKFSDDFEPDEAEKMKIRFFREAESAGTLSHPNIVTIYDAGDEQDLAYIAMEFLEGEDLEKYIKKENLIPMRKVIEYMADVADALSYAHDKGVVHRDIKPANIMLLKTGVVKITDFGIARITATSQTQTGVVKGTPFYMSPEQISGEKVDGKSDLFSLGVMMFQLLTGIVPFKGDSPAALMHQILNMPHPDPRDTNPKIVKPLVKIIDKLLEKDTSKRYQNGMQAANHLRILGKKIDAAIAKKQEQA
ncbi:MAG: CHASE2 domain-containing protein [Desulfobacterales bacterium]|jgi:eukaryotic-like serine/threonine-protein kinase|nr:CHASE2 domain-containing protein [Desulfobacteraceae bacterium]MBT7085985.1 CHASE2 domain-containing protein [Desulfobacterales bacterium]MBT7698385.1 CHASE2 domain-containing protein [Desulfobacterales bacterium]